MRKFVRVRRYKTGASWPNGKPRMCGVCGAEKARGERARRNRAVLTATDVTSTLSLPMAYCEAHIPEQLRKDET